MLKPGGEICKHHQMCQYEKAAVSKAFCKCQLKSKSVSPTSTQLMEIIQMVSWFSLKICPYKSYEMRCDCTEKHKSKNLLLSKNYSWNVFEIMRETKVIAITKKTSYKLDRIISFYL